MASYERVIREALADRKLPYSILGQHRHIYDMCTFVKYMNNSDIAVMNEVVKKESVRFPDLPFEKVIEGAVANWASIYYKANARWERFERYDSYDVVVQTRRPVYIEVKLMNSADMFILSTGEASLANRNRGYHFLIACKARGREMYSAGKQAWSSPLLYEVVITTVNEKWHLPNQVKAISFVDVPVVKTVLDKPKTGKYKFGLLGGGLPKK